MTLRLNLQIDIMKTNIFLKVTQLTKEFHSLDQLINEPKLILKNSSSCFHLISTSQPNLVIESGAPASLHSSCLHQIVLVKFNFKICYLLPYSRQIWHFKEAETDLIRRALNDFNWGESFFEE